MNLKSFVKYWANFVKFFFLLKIFQKLSSYAEFFSHNIKIKTELIRLQLHTCVFNIFKVSPSQALEETPNDKFQ